MLDEIIRSTWPACTQPDPGDADAVPFIADAVSVFFLVSSTCIFKYSSMRRDYMDYYLLHVCPPAHSPTPATPRQRLSSLTR
jgi:hypothetical protein